MKDEEQEVKRGFCFAAALFHATNKQLPFGIFRNLVGSVIPEQELGNYQMSVLEKVAGKKDIYSAHNLPQEKAESSGTKRELNKKTRVLVQGLRGSDYLKSGVTHSLLVINYAYGNQVKHAEAIFNGPGNSIISFDTMRPPETWMKRITPRETGSIIKDAWSKSCIAVVAWPDKDGEKPDLGKAFSPVIRNRRGT